MSLLKKMERLHKEEGELGMKPNGKSFKSVISCRASCHLDPNPNPNHIFLDVFTFDIKFIHIQHV